VSVGVVDLLEMIDVEHENADGRAFSCAAADFRSRNDSASLRL
jgi:hypothetical protein